MEELEKILRLAADSCSFAGFQDELGELLEKDTELEDEIIEKAAGGVKWEREEKT